MPVIKPVSDLRNYGTILKDIAPGQPVILTKNGQGKYALYIDNVEYDFGHYGESLKGTTSDGIAVLVKFDGRTISLFINDVQVSYIVE